MTIRHGKSDENSVVIGRYRVMPDNRQSDKEPAFNHHSGLEETLRRCFSAIALMVLIVLSPMYHTLAIGTQAGTEINNQATVTYAVDTVVVLGVSNVVTTTVAEIINVVVVWLDAADIAVYPGDTDQALTFQMTNTGNGNEDYSLSATSALAGDDFDPILKDLYLDRNADGLYSPGIDDQYIPGANDPTLAPDESAIVFALNDIPSGISGMELGNSQLLALSNTGVGPPGTIITDAGEGGTDAVIGNSGGYAGHIGTYVVSDVIVTIAKFANTIDPYGGSNPMTGAVVTYSLVVSVSGIGKVKELMITDPIPVNTSYNVGTLFLNNIGLTDAKDTDAGDVSLTTPNTMTVDFGDSLIAPTVQTITFDVTIN